MSYKYKKNGDVVYIGGTKKTYTYVIGRIRGRMFKRVKPKKWMAPTKLSYVQSLAAMQAAEMGLIGPT